MQALPIIADRGEFIDVLSALARGHMLVHLGDRACTVDGVVVYRAYEPLARYGLIRECDKLRSAAVRYFRLSEHGRDFAARALHAWRRRPLIERLAMRLVG
jgi:hypothetical protein